MVSIPVFFFQKLYVDIKRETRSFIKFDKEGNRPLYEEKITDKKNAVSYDVLNILRYGCLSINLNHHACHCLPDETSIVS